VWTETVPKIWCKHSGILCIIYVYSLHMHFLCNLIFRRLLFLEHGAILVFAASRVGGVNVDTLWPRVWKTWKCQGIWNMSGKSVPKLFITSWIFAFNSFFSASLLLRGAILHLCSLKMSGKVGEFDHDWRVAALSVCYVVENRHSFFSGCRWLFPTVW